jgi:hypothetical protein
LAGSFNPVKFSHPLLPVHPASGSCEWFFLSHDFIFLGACICSDFSEALRFRKTRMLTCKPSYHEKKNHLERSSSAVFENYRHIYIGPFQNIFWYSRSYSY